MIRSETFWNGERLTLAAKNAREFQRLMHTRLREACNWAEIERLRDHNADLIARLDRATREDVLAALAAREKELRANG